ncbi:MAG: hypothetical protein IBJ03_07295 [Gemmatimonadaceae bacterium]|nr:hypothetical protein [Gemmatimonadaceae bacterium]
MTRHAARRQRRTRNQERSGFTLVELIIALCMTAMFGVVVARVMMAQQRYFQRIHELGSVRRELRTALGMLPADLWSLSTVGGDIADFSAQSLTVRSTLGASFVCARSGSNSIDLPPLGSARTTTTSWNSAPVIGDTVRILRSDSSGVSGDYWSAHQITAISTSTAYCASSPYLDASLDGAKVRYRFTVVPALPDSVTTGSAVRFTRPARWTLAKVTSGRWYLHRAEFLNGSWGTETPVSGPYMAPSSGGLVMTYFDSLGVSLTQLSERNRIARLEIILRGQGMTLPAAQGAPAGAIDKRIIDSLAFTVAVRNRQ